MAYGDGAETHVSLHTVVDQIIPDLDSQLADQNMQVSPDISDDSQRTIAQSAANDRNWYENHAVFAAEYAAAFPDLAVPVPT